MVSNSTKIKGMSKIPIHLTNVMNFSDFSTVNRHLVAIKGAISKIGRKRITLSEYGSPIDLVRYDKIIIPKYKKTKISIF
jgi:hypothetical protein